MDRATENQYRRFGPFELDVGGGQLKHKGAIVRLEPQPLKILALLTERPGLVVSRSEIRETVWGPDTYVDFDQGLNYCIRKIRLSLGDNSANPVYLETLPKKGYRFVHPVEEGIVGPNGSAIYPGRRSRVLRTGSMQKGVAVLAVASLLVFGTFLIGGGVPGGDSGAKSYPPEAGQALVRGRYLAQDGTPQGLRRSLAYYERAIEIAPAWPEPYAALGSARLALGEVVAAREASEKAIHLDTRQGEALRTLAIIGLYRFDWASAEKNFRRARESNPPDADTLRHYANFLSATGRHEEAIRAIGRAIDLDPLSLLVQGDAGWHYFLARRYAEAAEQCHLALELSPGNSTQHWLLGQIHAQAGRPQLALSEAVAFVDIVTGNPEGGSALRREFARAGLPAVWGELLNRAEQMPPAAMRQFAYHSAALAAQLSDLPGTMRWLKKAKDSGTGTLIFLGADPQFDSVRDAREFQDFLSRLRPPGT